MKQIFVVKIFLLFLLGALSACAFQQNSPISQPKETLTKTIDSTVLKSTTTTDLIDNRYDSIHQAAEYGDTEAVNWYLENGIPVDSKDPEMGGSPLHWAASLGHPEVVTLLIENGANLRMKDVNGATPLHLAAETGQLSVCSILVEKENSLLYEVDNSGAMPIHIAAWNGHKPIIDFFLNQGTNINIRDNDLGGTPLHWAAFNGQTSTVSFLLQKGADPSIIDNKGDTARELAEKQNQKMAADALADWEDLTIPVLTQTNTNVPAEATQPSRPSPLCQSEGKPATFSADNAGIMVGTFSSAGNCGEDFSACPFLESYNPVSAVDQIILEVPEGSKPTQRSLTLLLKISIEDHPVSSRHLWEFFVQSRLMVAFEDGDIYEIDIDAGLESETYGGVVYYVALENADKATPLIGLNIPVHEIVPLVTGEYEFVWCYENGASQPLIVKVGQ